MIPTWKRCDVSLSPDPSPRAYGLTVLSDEAGLFTGRHQALTDIGAWLHAPEPTVMIVTGGAGTGKSALLSRLWALSQTPGREQNPSAEGSANERASGNEHASANEQASGNEDDSGSEESSGNGPDDGQHDVAGMIHLAVDAHGRTAAELLDALCAGAGCATGRVEDLLAATHRRQAPLVVAVDGIDEAADPEHVVTNLFGPLAGAAPDDRLRLLLAMDRRLVPLLGGARVVDLERDEYLDPDGLREYTLRCLTSFNPRSPYGTANPTRTVATADAVATAAGPAYLVAQVVARNLADRGDPVDPEDPAWLATLPTTPAEAIAWDLATRLDPTDARRAVDLLLPLAYAQGAGLPWAGVWAAVASAASGWAYTDDDLAWLRRVLGRYILEVADAGQLTYRPAHRALAGYLRAGYAAAGRDASAMHAAFAAVLTEQVPQTVEATPDWAAAHPYTRTHLATHAAAAGQLGRLLVDPRFLLAAEPTRLAAALPSASGAEARAVAEWHRRDAQAPGDETDRLARLELAAHCAGATALAAAAGRLGGAPPGRGSWADAGPGRANTTSARPWRTRWANWSAPRYSRTMTGGHQGSVLALVTVRLAGRRLAVTGGTDGALRVWDLASGQPVGPAVQLSAAPVRALVATVDEGHAVVVAGGRGGTAYRWQVFAPEPVTLATGLAGDISALALARIDGSPVVVAGDDDGSLAVCRLADAEALVGAWTGHSGAVRAIAPATLDSWDLAVTVGADGMARAWEVATGQPLGPPLAGRAGGACAAATVAVGDDILAITAAQGGGLDMWGLVEPHHEALSTGSTPPAEALAVGVAGGRVLAVTGGSDRTVRVWDLAARQLWCEPLTGHQDAITAVAMDTADAETPVAVAACADGSLRIWDLVPGETPAPAGTPVTDVQAVTVDAPRVVAATAAGDVRALDLGSGEVLGPAKHAHPGGATTVSVATVAGRRELVTTGTDGHLRRWDLDTAEPAGDTAVCGAPVRAVALTRLFDRSIAVLADADGSVEVRALDEAEARPTLPTYRGAPVTALCAPPSDGGSAAGRSIVLAGCADGAVALWDLSGRRTITVLGHHAAPVTALATVDVGGLLLVVSAAEDHSVWRWDVPLTARSRWAARPRPNPLDLGPGPAATCAAAHVPAGGAAPVVVLGSEAGVRLWSPPAAVTRIDLPSPVSAVALTADGGLVVAGRDGVAAFSIGADGPAAVTARPAGYAAAPGAAWVAA